MAKKRQYHTEITAQDKTDAAFRSFKANIDSSQRKIQDLQRYAATIAGGALAVGFMAASKRALEFADNVGDAAERAGMATEEFSALTYAAKQKDVAMADLENTIRKLTLAQAAAAAGDEKYLKAFRAMRIEIRDGSGQLKSARDLFLEISDVLSKTQGPDRMRAANELLSKSFGAVLPLINAGSGEIRRLEQEARDLGKTVSEETSQAADKFGKDLDKLTDNSAELARELSTGLLPALSKIAVAMLQGRKEGGVWEMLRSGATAAMEEVNGAELEDQLDRVNEKIALAEKTAKRLREQGTTFLGVERTGEVQQAAKLNQLLQERRNIEKAIFDRELKAQTDRALAHLARKGGQGGAGTIDGDAAEKYARDLEALYNRLDATTETVNAKFWQELNMLHAEFVKGGEKDLPTYRRRVEELINSTEYGKQVLKDATEATKEAIEATTKNNQAVEKAHDLRERATKSMLEEVEALELDVEMLGKTNGEREIAIRLLDLQRAGVDTNTAAVQNYVDRMRNAQQALEAYNNTMATANDAVDRAVGLIDELATTTENRFQVMIRWVKDFAREMLALFARKWLLQIAAAAVGGSAGAALAGQAGQVGAGSLAGAGMNWASSIASPFISSAAVGAANWLGGAGSSLTAMGGFADFAVGWQAASQGLTVASLEGATAMTQFGASLQGVAGILGIFAAVIAGMIANDRFFGQGWRADDQDGIADMPGGPLTGDRLLRGLGLNDRWASLLSGSSLHTRLWGHRAIQADAYGLRGSVGASGVTAETWQDWSRQGGTFRSDIRGTETGSLSGSQAAFFANLLRPVTQLIDGLAGRYGVSASAAIAGYSRPFNMQMSNNGEPLTAEEANALFRELFVGVLQDQVALVLDEAGKGPLAEFIRGLSGSTEEIASTIEAVLGLIDATDQLGRAIAELEGGPIVGLRNQLKAMAENVQRAEKAFTEAIASNDPARILEAGRALTQSIMERYQQEIAMVREIQAAIRATQQQAYEFALAMADRINAVGGSRDQGAIAMNRANVLRGQVGTGPIALQIQNVQQYVGAIDTWYNARRNAILEQMEREREAQHAAAAAGQAAAQARLSSLEAELNLAQQFQSVVDQTQRMIDDMRLSSANPLPVRGRLELARGDVDRLRAEYESSTGEARVIAANRLLEALQTLRGLGMESHQRPTAEWEALYNEIMGQLTFVQADARSLAERTVEIQAEILETQRLAAFYAEQMASAGATSSAALEALDREALAYYEWAETQGLALLAEQERQHQEALTAITGGQDVELYIAERGRETVELLRSIDTRIQAWLDNPPAAATTPAGDGTPAPVVNITVNAGPGADSGGILKAIKAALPEIKRELAKA